MKAFSDNKINLNENFKSVFGRVEKIKETEENAGYQGG